jgi:hypothetical protein
MPLGVASAAGVIGSMPQIITRADLLENEKNDQIESIMAFLNGCSAPQPLQNKVRSVNEKFASMHCMHLIGYLIWLCVPSNHPPTTDLCVPELHLGHGPVYIPPVASE